MYFNERGTTFSNANAENSRCFHGSDSNPRRGSTLALEIFLAFRGTYHVIRGNSALVMRFISLWELIVTKWWNTTIHHSVEFMG